MENTLTYLKNYDLFIFDFDGTIMDTEYYHCLAWNILLSTVYHISDLELFTFEEYCRFSHSLDNTDMHKLLYYKYNITDSYEEIHKLKNAEYNRLIQTSGEIRYIPGFLDMLDFLLKEQKKFIIVTNTSQKNIEVFLNKHPELTNADKIYTKEDFLFKKPNPDCYLKICNDYPNCRKIGFEDSYKGFHTLYQFFDEITPVLIYNRSYYWSPLLLRDYANIIKIEEYVPSNLNFEINIQQLYLIRSNSSNSGKNNYSVNNINSNNSNIMVNDKRTIHKIVDNTIFELQKNAENIKNIVYQISILLQNNIYYHSQNIYLTGMGKSSHICKKSVSTWNGLGIKCGFIDLPNLSHGDFGIFRDNDMILFVSNSGNTEELINVLRYIKNTFNDTDTLSKKIITIGIIANRNSIIEQENLATYLYFLENIQESDSINMTPSTSSVIFMTLLDSIAINMRKDITKAEFQLYHPHGALGKK